MNLVAILLGQTIVVGHDELAVDFHGGTFLGVVEGYDGNVLEADVLPDVEFRPVGEGEHADALALVYAGIVDVPEFRTLVLGVPLVELVAEGENTFLCA